MRKIIDVLVGNIASGKSTYTKQYPNAVIISKDDIRKEFARSIGEGYIFDPTLETFIDTIVWNYICGYVEVGSPHIIIDETNMTKETRWGPCFAGKNAGYEVRAIMFPDVGEDEHVRRRLKDNHGDTTEETWREVYRRKASRYEPPSLGEGFDGIIYG